MKIPKQHPWSPVEVTVKGATLCQSLAEGVANEFQQRDFMVWLMNEVCCVNDLEFRPDSERDTAFASGKRFVGMQVKKHLSVKIGALKEKEKGVNE